MAFFDDINVDETQEVVDASVREAKSWIKESGAYDVEVTMFRFKESAGGAKGFVVEMITENGEQIKEEEWFSSKAGDTTYAVKDRKTKMPTGERKDLPGMVKLKSISRALTGDPLSWAKTTEAKMVPIYNYEKQEEVDTEVGVFVGAIGQKVKVLVQRAMEDKTAKNPATGDYEPTAEYKEINEIVGWVDVETGKTFSEIAAGTEAKSFTAFKTNVEKTPVKDRRKVSKGAPVGQAAAATTAGTTAEPSEAAKSAFA